MIKLKKAAVSNINMKDIFSLLTLYHSSLSGDIVLLKLKKRCRSSKDINALAEENVWGN